MVRETQPMENLSYPLNRNLSAAQMVKRIQAFNSVLHAVRFYKNPNADCSIHLLVKDNIGVRDWPSSAGSFALKNLRLPDAFCIEQLRKNPRIDIFGKTHLTELAGFVTSSVLKRGYSELGGFGRNPYGGCFPCGGSSVGSAVAVSAGFCDAALGTETRGSIMIPAMYNGVYGFKPTRGSISRTGIIPLSSSFDAPGVLARNPELLKEVFLSMTGYDSSDPQSFDFSFCPKPFIRSRPRLLFLRNSSQVSSALNFFFIRLADLGISVVELETPQIVFDYKEISSSDIKRDMTKFLEPYGSASEPKSFRELVEKYRSRPESHRYGMERLEDALAMREPKDKELANRNIEKANDLIESLLLKYDADYIVSSEYLDWWAIGGGPTIAFPVDLGKTPPGCLMVGTRRNGDLALLSLVKAMLSVWQ